MSTIDPYDRIDDRRHRSHRHSRDDREPRYVETEETYVRGAPAVPEAPYAAVRHTELVRRPHREDSDLSIEEVRRDFPPPGSRSIARDDRYGPPVRSRSAERGYGDYLDDPRRSYHDDDRRSRKSQLYADQEVVKPRRRSLSRNQKIIAGVGGAALALAGKELWDRKQADGRPVSRNPLQSAAVGAAGALAAYEGAEMYAKHGGKEKIKTYIAHKDRDGDVEEYYSSEEEKPKTKSRRKSIVEGALGLAGLGAAAKATGGSGRSRRGSGDSHRSTRSRSRAGGRGKSPEGAAKFQQAAKAALLAGATEAFRVRNEPGGWGGAKGKRILTAAIGAGSIDAAADRNPGQHGKRHILEAVVGGLAGNRLINGSRKDVEDDDGRSSRGGRSRSRARSRSKGPGGSGAGAGLAALATAGIGALAGKKLLDRSRSRSRAGDNRSRSRGSGRRRGSPDSYDSRSPSPRAGKDRHKRSKSVTDYARKGLAAIGLGEAASESGGRDRDVEYEETRVHKSSRRRRDRSEDDGYEPRGSRGSRDDGYSQRGSGGVYDDPRYADSRSSNLGSTRDGGGRRRSGGKAKQGRKDRRVAEGKQDASDSDSLGSSSEDEKRIKKMKGKQLLTAGLATVATIHAAHNVYQSIEKRDARHRAVQEGEMTPEEARKLKAKATLQDVASVGIAALGIKGAISEIKEANEMRHECKELNEKKAERHQKRLERRKMGSSTSGSRRGDDYRRDDDYYDQVPSGRRIESAGPRYTDGNPYSTGLPAPPVGYDDRR
ncbi:hypothetical protein LSUB1_G003116 [Lachnellula subtilissima]|uniref:DUF3824 domain-containing protein n=1 Tax=Lachnellula subtilissima TaxID=602034 RepID=A0A8H8RT81_9HELO|nr:hypothetical protein LSUB1_G003116 [Lachnellula subtilissima]